MEDHKDKVGSQVSWYFAKIYVNEIHYFHCVAPSIPIKKNKLKASQDGKIWRMAS